VDIKVMKIDCIADTHGIDLKSIVFSDDADMVIIAGDITRNSRIGSYIYAIESISKLPHKYKVLIAGNHDGGFRYLKPDWGEFGIIYLEQDIVEIEGIRIAGSPYTPKFGNWGFMEPDEDLAERWEVFEHQNIDILITHGPPYGVLDENKSGFKCGSRSLLASVVERIRPIYHIFGHIHEARGKTKIITRTTGIKDRAKLVTFLNVSVLDHNYRLQCIYPVTIEIDK
jgi:Icc-related predicted phosphoesterase